MVIGSGVIPREISRIGSVAGPQFDHENPRFIGSWKQLWNFINWKSRQNFNNKHNDAILRDLYHFAFWTISTSLCHRVRIIKDFGDLFFSDLRQISTHSMLFKWKRLVGSGSEFQSLQLLLKFVWKSRASVSKIKIIESLYYLGLF
jgi:hypothetical protein